MKSKRKDRKILVSGASGIVGYGILRSLRRNHEKGILIGTSIYNDSIAPAFCDIFELAPKTNEPFYIDWLCKTIRKHNVNMVIPGIEIDMITWNRERKRINKTGTFALLNNSELIELCVDKWKFYKRLNSTSSKLAIESRLEGSFEGLKEDFGLPFLLKPRSGFGSKGIVIVENKEVFQKNVGKLGAVLMAQPIVGSDLEEYSTSAFFDRECFLLTYITLRRTLSKDGFTEKAEVVNLGKVKEAIEELSKIFKPIGPTNFQFRLKEGQLKLLEINPRISSATSIRAAFGYNESFMSVNYFLNGTPPIQPRIRRGHAVRYIEDHIFYDSTNI